MADDTAPMPACKCGAPVHPRDETRCKHGHTLVGYRGPAWKHGVRSYEARGSAALPPDLRQDIDTLRGQLVADRGGRDALTAIEAGYIQHLIEAETVLRMTAADVARRGLVRGTLERWLATMVVWDRFAQRLGLSRRERPVLDLARSLSGLEDA